MNTEAPLITRALRLVSFAIIISTVAVAGTAGYSAYQEYNALASLGSSQSQLTQSFNGTTMTLGGLVIPNNMSYPLSLRLLGSIYIASIHISDFATQTQVIQPGASAPLSLSINLNFSKVLQNQAALEAMLFKPFDLALNATIDASVVPLIGLNISKSVDQVYQPLLANLSTILEYQKASLSSDNKSVLIPLVLNWANSSPLSLSGTLNATLVGIPGQPKGNYGGGTGPLSVTQGQNQNTVTLAFPRSGPLANEFIYGNYTHGTYTFDLNLGAYGLVVPFEENVTL